MFRSLCSGLVFAALAVTALADDPATDVKAMKKEAGAAFQAQDWKKSAEVLRKVVELAPNDALAWHNLGYSLHMMGQLDDALVAHMKCAEIKGPNQAAGAYNAACVFALKGDKEQAFTWLDKAVTLGFGQTALLDSDTDLKALRGDPRLDDIKARSSKNDTARAFGNSTARRSTRVAYFTNTGCAGELAIDYGPVDWAAKLDEQIASGKLDGQRWRLGRDYWTTLDNSIPMTFGDVTVPAGHWYLVATKSGDAYTLLCLDSAAVRAQKLDAFQSNQTKGGIAIPMTHSSTRSSEAQLHIELTTDGNDDHQGDLTIGFGPHQLTTHWSVKT